MPPIKPHALCVSIHDVAPATWPLCLKLAESVRAVAPIPLTWLVVPHYHGDSTRSLAVEAQLDFFRSEGHELALHGYTHRDDRPSEGGLRERFLRRVYTQAEGEFSALSASDAAQRLMLGAEWFTRRGWPLGGFVPPAWLLSEEAWQVLRASPFQYTTTYSHFHSLPTGQALRSPSLVYTARNRLGRWLSPRAASMLARSLAPAPLLRLSLHPRDALYPRLLRHAQRLIERFLLEREPMTKLAFSRHYFGVRPALAPRPNELQLHYSERPTRG